jgi:proteasome alpha subunit
MPEIMPAEYMGYDRTIAVFSPDGRLFQVEYAKEAVKRGTTCLGIVFKDGVLLATIKPTTTLIVNSSLEKIFEIDDHIGAVASGLLADARVLVNQVRVKAQVHKITYEEIIDVWGLARALGDRMQISTLYAGLRPFGVSFLVGGIDKTGPHIIESDPSGMLYEWKAYAIGRGGVLANKIFKQKWNPNLTEKDAIGLAMEVINKVEKERKEGSVDMAIINSADKRFRKLDEEDIKKALK